MNKEFKDTFGWEVESHPVQFVNLGGEVCEDADFQVISRNDTDKALSVMSKKYLAMGVTEFEKVTNRMQELSGMTLQGYQEYDGGKVILSILKNENPIEVLGYPIEDYLVLGNSFNGEQTFFIGTSTVLIRCQNQFSQIHMLSKTRHTANSEAKRELALEGMEAYFKERERMYKNFERISKVEFDENMKEAFVAKILRIPNPNDTDLATRTINRRNDLFKAINEETAVLGNNGFGVFNGLTKYTTHVYKPRKEAPFGNILGTANDLNQIGYRLCVDLADLRQIA